MAEVRISLLGKMEKCSFLIQLGTPSALYSIAIIASKFGLAFFVFVSIQLSKVLAVRNNFGLPCRKFTKIFVGELSKNLKFELTVYGIVSLYVN